MSEPVRVGVVAEGPTDHLVIEQVVAAHFGPREVEYAALQPELSAAFTAVESDFGFGWGGVFRWATQVREEGGGSFSNSYLAGAFDAVVVHVDCDVARASYADIAVVSASNDLPCAVPCPPAIDTIVRLESVVLGWLGELVVPPKLATCIPAQSIEGWLLLALYPEDPASLAGETDCLADPVTRLATKPISGRLISGRKKKVEMYRARAPEVRNRWHQLVAGSPSAARFEAALNTILIPQ
jgi:hypothetical protein